MLTIQIDNPNIENIFLEGFNSNKEKFLEFIQYSYQQMKLKESSLQDIGEAGDTDLKKLQIDSMINAWDNDNDKVWDEL